MRDPDRIRPFLNTLAAKWEQYPDLRFGQLIINVAGDLNGDPWYAEEEDWEWAIESFGVVPSQYRGKHAPSG